MLSLPAGKRPLLRVAVALITNSKETKAGSSGSCGGSGNPGREGDVGTEVPAHSSSHKAAALCTRLIKNQIVLTTSSLGPFPWLAELGRERALCAIQSMTALLCLDFCASHLCEEFFFFPF